jgi:hypothetical protein
MSAKSLVACGATLAALLLSGSANAFCNVAGNWYMYDVKIGNGSASYGGTAVNFCSLTTQNNGTFSGTCQIFGMGNPQSSATISGNMNADAQCHLSGTFNPSGTTSFSIMGQMNGRTATAISAGGNPIGVVRFLGFQKL